MTVPPWVDAEYWLQCFVFAGWTVVSIRAVLIYIWLRKIKVTYGASLIALLAAFAGVVALVSADSVFFNPRDLSLLTVIVQSLNVLLVFLLSMFTNLIVREAHFKTTLKKVIDDG